MQITEIEPDEIEQNIFLWSGHVWHEHLCANGSKATDVCPLL